jgi:hypothetical protein
VKSRLLELWLDLEYCSIAIGTAVVRGAVQVASFIQHQTGLRTVAVDTI